MFTDRSALRRFTLVAMVLALGACQTIPRQYGFTSRQVAALERAGFKRHDSNYELGIDNRVLFQFDSSALQPTTANMIRQLADTLKSVGIHGATVEGHTDATGRPVYNQHLSEERARSVKGAFVREGMPQANIRAYGVGESDPIESNATEAGRQQNRRVVIIVTPEDALPVASVMGGMN